MRQLRGHACFLSCASQWPRNNFVDAIPARRHGFFQLQGKLPRASICRREGANESIQFVLRDRGEELHAATPAGKATRQIVFSAGAPSRGTPSSNNCEPAARGAGQRCCCPDGGAQFLQALSNCSIVRT